MTYLNPNTVLKPTANVAYGDAEFLQEMIGNREDKSFSNGAQNPSVLGALKAGYFHVHDKAKVYPTGVGEYGADPVPLISGDTDPWIHGGKIEVVPANTIDKWFDIHWVVLGTAPAVDDYELRVYAGAELAEEEIGRIAFSREAIQDRSTVNLPIQIPPQPANTRISMSLACGDGDGAGCSVKIYYHTYPDIT
jgi:hypothetical protein